MSDLTPANDALMQEGNLEKVRVGMQLDCTPPASSVALLLPIWMHELVMAEEYGHHTLSKEEAIRRAQERIDMVVKAIKEDVITSIKCRRGEWIAVA